MASSRLERIGTIFSRVEGLIRSGAMRPEDRPLWWDIYKAFPPTREPLFARPVPNMDMRQIFYPEDAVRAKFHKSGVAIGTVNLNDNVNPSNAQKLIQIQKKLQEESGDKNADFYLESLETLKQEIGNQREEFVSRKESVPDPIEEQKQGTNIKNLFD